MRSTPRRALRFALPTLAALGAGATVGLADIPSTDGTINACINPASTPPGAVRIIDTDAGQTCQTGEKSLTWNQTGPAGPPGPQGDPGLPGDTSGVTPDTTTTPGTTSTPNDTFATPTQAGGPSADIFLRLDGIPGGSTDDKHKDQIDVSSFAFALGRGADGTGTSGGVPGAAPSTKARLQTLRIDKVYDAASPKLLRAAATGQRIKTATLTFRRTDDSGDLEFLTYTLGDVQVTSYNQGGKDGDARDLGSLEEEVGLTAARIHVSEQTVTADGSKGPVVTADWTVPKATTPKATTPKTAAPKK
jgi:type VI secretion system secreted protein Hcp